MKTVVTLKLNYTYKVMYDDRAKVNPYRIYRFTEDSKDLIERYGNLASCMYFLADVVYVYDE